jgi:hypothetical protein
MQAEIDDLPHLLAHSAGIRAKKVLHRNRAVHLLGRKLWPIRISPCDIHVELTSAKPINAP